MKKKLLLLIFSVVLASSVLGGCGGSGATPAPTSSEQVSADATQNQTADPVPAAEGEVKYALVMSHMSNAFTTTFADNAKAKADEMGIKLTVFDGNKDSATQINQIETAITQGFAGIMVEPVSVDGIKPAVEAANNAGVPIMTVIQMMTEQNLAKCYVGGDDKAAGILEMEKAIEAIGGKGNVAILYGPMGSDGQLIRKEGYDEVLAKNPDVQIVFEQTANWVTDEALKITENWLQSGKEINAIVSQNDGMAIGALKAVEDAKLSDQIQIFGVDATPDGIAAIEAGRMAGTVSQDVAGMGRLAMETLSKIVNGEQVDAVIRTTPVWVTIDNISDVTG